MMGAQAEDSHSLEDQRTEAFTGKSEISLQRTGFRIRFAAMAFVKPIPGSRMEPFHVVSCR